MLQLSILLFETFLRLSTSKMFLLQSLLQAVLVHLQILRANCEMLPRQRLRERGMDRYDILMILIFRWFNVCYAQKFA